MLNIKAIRRKIDKVDKRLAKLFCKRMDLSKSIAEYKEKNGLPVFDKAREQAVVEKNVGLIKTKEYRPYYISFLRKNMLLSKQYQFSLKDDISVKTANGAYTITLKNGAIKNADKIFNLNRKVLIVTDSGVPENYTKEIEKASADPTVYIIPQGEENKTEEQLFKILEALAKSKFTRGDCIVAVGGGVVGDIAGLAASLYMRGIDFYNVPTTLLAQVDSSIGGKTAINLLGFKNIVGAFWQPKAVLIDPETLKTLPSRQLSNGFAEVIKMSLTHDKALFEIFENGKESEKTEEVIKRALLIKKSVVESDEQENGLRKALNFGHTVAHAIESVTGGELYHGECVAVGMLYMCSESVKSRLLPVLKRLNLPTEINCDKEKLTEALCHDKKSKGEKITTVFVNLVGSFEFKDSTIEEITAKIKEGL